MIPIWNTKFKSGVSIVSIKQINPDPMKYRKGIPVFPSFNRINPDRLFPTIYPDFIDRLVEQFQSYQSKQINPDASWIRLNSTDSYSCFNRINPNRSIPTRLRLARHEKHYTVSIVSIQTDQSRPDAYGVMGATINLFQSYQSRQINPDYCFFFC